MSFDVTTLLGFHVVVSLVGIATGLVVLAGLGIAWLVVPQLLVQSLHGL
jgi:uncharacterized oligopeptide transporter (OPT) family protein